MIDDKRFVAVEEIAISQAIHQPVAERVERLPRIGLWNTGATATTRRVESTDGNVGRPRESRVSRVHPINVKLPEVERVGSEIKEEVGRACRRSYRAVQVGRQ